MIFLIPNFNDLPSEKFNQFNFKLSNYFNFIIKYF
jgi:hypothetical protein